MRRYYLHYTNGVTEALQSAVLGFRVVLLHSLYIFHLLHPTASPIYFHFFSEEAPLSPQIFLWEII